MAANLRRITLFVIVIFLTSVLIAPGSASELSSAEQRYSELQRTNDANLEALNVLLPGYESESQQCINRLANSTNSDDVITREGCQVALSRFQSERIIIGKLIEETKAEMAALELRIQSLKSTSSGASSPGSTSSASTGASSNNSQSAPSAAADSTSTISNSQPAPTASDNPVPAQSPVAAQNQSSASPSVPVVTNKVTPSPKPKAKKRTITCTKGKVSRKVTAVKPVCPKGFKIKAKR